MKKVYNNITELVGNTPIVKLNNLIKHYNLKANIYAKIEYFNPTGSVKDRIAKAMVDDAIAKGVINHDTTIIEPTSGNTGIALASISSAYGLKSIIVMPESMSIERRNFLKAYGAEVVLTEAALGMKGSIAKANELHKQIPNSFIPSQFENKINPQIHYETTGKEIYEALDGKVDAFVAGVGTGGTISGVSKYLKSKNNKIEVVAVEPSTSPVLAKGVPGPHKIQGIGAGFIPNTLDTSSYDQISHVSTEEAFDMVREISHLEGIFIGISSGASLKAALKLASSDEYKGKNIVVLLPDNGDRYFSLLF